MTNSFQASFSKVYFSKVITNLQSLNLCDFIINMNIGIFGCFFIFSLSFESASNSDLHLFYLTSLICPITITIRTECIGALI